MKNNLRLALLLFINMSIPLVGMSPDTYSEKIKNRITVLAGQIIGKITFDSGSQQNFPNKSLKPLHEDISLIMERLSQGEFLDRSQKCALYQKQCKELGEKYTSLIPQHNAKKQLRVMTYNVHFWCDGVGNSNIEHVLELIKKTNADVVCLQEVCWGNAIWNKYSTSELTKLFRKMGYSYGGDETFVYGKHVAGAPFGNIMFSKYKLENINKITFKVPKHGELRAVVGGTIMFNNAPVRIYTTHLDVWDDTGWSRDSETKELINHIQKHDKDCSDVMVLGDFNAVRKRDYQYTCNGKKVWDLLVQDDALRKVATTTFVEDNFDNYGFKDVYQELNYLPPFTCWSGKIIDFCYRYSPDQAAKINCKGFYPYYTSISDHLPMIFDFAVKN